MESDIDASRIETGTDGGHQMAACEMGLPDADLLARLFKIIELGVKVSAGENLSSQNDHLNLFRVTNVPRGVGIENDQIGTLAGRNRAEFRIAIQKAGGVDRRRLDGRQGG